MLKFLAYIVCYCIYPISFLFPRRDDLLIFGSFRGSFNENAKYLYLYCQEHVKDKRSIWISTSRETAIGMRQKGLTSFFLGSPQGLWYALRGKYWFINSYTSDILFCLAGGAIVVNLWHGLPWKCIEFGINKGELANRYSKKNKLDAFEHPAIFRKPNYVLSAGEKMTKIFAKSFLVDQTKCLPYGYPRDMLLRKDKDSIMNFVQLYENEDVFRLVKRLEDYKKVYIYMPTWRDTQRNFIATGIDLNVLNEKMKEKNAVLIFKPHSNTILPLNKALSNVLFIDRMVDIYCILPFTNVLITDYSSIMFDYPLMKEKGMILYQYDYDEYVKEREFNFPLEGNIIGKKVCTFAELLEVIDKDDDKLNEQERNLFIQKFWGHTMDDGQDVCANILNAVL